MNVHVLARSGPALRLTEKSADLDALKIDVVERDAPQPGPGQVLVEILAAGVNPSDVKAALGHMPYAVWPRTPGRDFAGIVREGPKHLLGLEIWGGGGELGITQDGSHARWMVLPQAAVRAKPANLSMEEAGAVGVPFVTAFEGLREAGGVQPWDAVMVCGANGKVGQAAIQLATLAGARVFAVNRDDTPYLGHASGEVTVIDASQEDAAEVVRAATGGRGADIVYNTVGSPYFDVGNRALAKGGRHIFIATLERAVDFDIFTFFRGRHRFIGVDTLALDSTYGAKVFDVLKPEFERGRLRPFPVAPSAVHRLEDAAAAYAKVLRWAPERIVLKP